MVKILALLLFLALAPVLAWGDTLQISCVAPTACKDAKTTQLTSSTGLTFDLLNVGQPLSGEAYLAVLVPGPATAPVIPGATLDDTITFTKGKLGNPGNLDEAGMDGYTFSSFASASSQAGGKPESFTVYEWHLGKYSSLGNGKAGIYVDVAGLTKGGDVLVGWVESTTGKHNANGLEQTPLLNSLSVDGSGFRSLPPPSPTPEPTSLLLLGTGLMALGKTTRWRLSKQQSLSKPIA